MTGHVIRQTRQKDAVRKALHASGDFVTAQELHRQLEDEGSTIGLATVYRQLNMLAEAGHADTIQLNGSQLFRMCDDPTHHHHLVCTKCGKTVEIEPPDETWLRKTAAAHGFTVSSHTLEMFGLCEDCQQDR
ncbi:Fur family transcriptional regulator [Bifidobacterium aquikefiricola]|uniref:Transcriptional repressor n=1 Tax=Bifidobacterium aquikefiricola TaxID=3059038 RepID=A0AB39U8F6_9BIFI